MRQRLWRQLLAGTLLGFLAWGSGVAGAAAAKADRVNVRSRPGYSGEVVTQLKKGQAVEVLETLTLRKPAAGEPPAWSKIALPTETPVWVSADHIDPTTHKVSADILNVRAGPSYEFGSLARLKRGAEVQPLGAAKDGWLRIAAPAGAFGYVPSVWLNGDAAVPAAKPATAKTTNAPEHVASSPAPTPVAAGSTNTLAPRAAAAAPPTNAPTANTPSPAAPVAPSVPSPNPVASTNPPPSTQLPGGVTVTAVPASGTPAVAVPPRATVPVTTPKPEAPQSPPSPAPTAASVRAASTPVTAAPVTSTVVAPPPAARPVSTNQSWFEQFVARPNAATNAVSSSAPNPSPTSAKPPATATATVAPAAPVAVAVKDEPVKSGDSSTSFSRPIQPRSQAKRAAAAKATTDSAPADASEAKPRRGPAPIPPRLAAMQADQVRSEPPQVLEGTPGRRVRREGTVIEPSNIQAPTFYGLQARDSGKTINFLFTTREAPLSWSEYYGRTVIVTGREYLDRRPFWRGIPLLDVENIEAAR